MKLNELPSENQNELRISIVKTSELIGRNVSDYAFICIKSLLMLNGGGAVALLSFKGVYFSKFGNSNWGNDVLSIFMLGIILSVLLLFGEFFRAFGLQKRWAKIFKDFLENKMDIEDYLAHANRKRNFGQYVSIALGVLSGLCFLLGLIYGGLYSVSPNLTVPAVTFFDFSPGGV
ncbi:MAG: hypothetical protein HOC91_17805 [Nitrospinaceae bacterium]|jgi:hypothetical protein|nr:hypothetical protein [Nitrospinaceae bacterium]MBT3435585.1 hypothetical protein [Nitrospinaceae bacterium]MBT3821402.1 hypothetical protein [Nitrospinaceae bacterium]MBT4095105.1 hypothetical protein [Nitrospinaceae bacterium]MBT4432368.1 hypothetical protein [Nitrospinaceae bacterium]